MQPLATNASVMVLYPLREISIVGVDAKISTAFKMMTLGASSGCALSISGTFEVNIRTRSKWVFPLQISNSQRINEVAPSCKKGLTFLYHCSAVPQV